MTNYIEQAAETTEADQAIQAHLRQACEHKIALHVDAAIDVVDTDPAEADAWAYEAGKEAWEFDIHTPEKLASHPALSAAFKRGFDSVEQQSRSQRDVLKRMESNERYVVVRLCVANQIQYLGRVSSLKEFEEYRECCGFEKSDIAVQDWKPAG